MKNPLSRFAKGCELGRCVPPSMVEQIAQQTSENLRNLYASPLARAMWRGMLHTLLKPSRRVGEQLEGQPQTNTNMKSTAVKTFLLAIAAALTGLANSAYGADSDSGTSGGKAETAKEKKAREAAEAAASLLDEEEEEEQEEEEEVTITKQMVKDALGEAIKANKSDKAMAILKKKGANNVGGLDESDYAEVHAAVTKLLK